MNGSGDTMPRVGSTTSTSSTSSLRAIAHIKNMAINQRAKRILTEDPNRLNKKEAFWSKRHHTHEDDPKDGDATIFSSAVALAATCVGTGLFALPYAFDTAGFGLGAVLLVLFAGISIFSSYAICKCADWTGTYAYEEVLEEAFGRRGAWIMEVFVIWLLIGAMTSALVVVRGAVTYVVFYSGLSEHWQSTLVLLDVGCVATPLSWMQSPNSLRHTNTLAVACTLIVSFLVMYRGTVCTGVAIDKWVERPSANFTFQAVQVIPIVMLSLGCQVQVPAMYGELHQKSLFRMVVVLLSSGGSCIIMYVGVAFFGILASQGCNSTDWVPIKGSVLQNFPTGDPYALAMQLIMAVTLTLVFPMLCLPCRSTLNSLLFGHSEDWHHVHRAGETLFIVVVTWFLSGADGDLASVFSFTGATAGAAICYIIPLACFLRLRRAQSADIQKSSRIEAVLCCVILACLVPLVIFLRVV